MRKLTDCENKAKEKMLTEITGRINWRETKNFLRGGVRLGGTIHSAATMASTQTPAKDAARKGAAHGSVYVTDFQSSGRGRRDREWTAAPGLDLTFSVILRQDIGASHAGLLNLAASLAVGGALEKIVSARPFSIGIKWPNDVMANGKKICGIICETKSAGRRIDFAVLGVGVNVNGAARDMPVFGSGDRPRATSVFIETEYKTSLPQLLGEILSNLDELAGMIESEDGRAALIDMYRKKSCTLGKQVRVVTEEGETRGVASGITDDGALSVTDAAGLVSTFLSADVVHAHNFPSDFF